VPGRTPSLSRNGGDFSATRKIRYHSVNDKSSNDPLQGAGRTTGSRSRYTSLVGSFRCKTSRSWRTSRVMDSAGKPDHRMTVHRGHLLVTGRREVEDRQSPGP
jgi:hypothetical protein